MTGSTENPSSLKQNQNNNFLGFMLETKPLELIYQGPTSVSQVLSPFSVEGQTSRLDGSNPGGGGGAGLLELCKRARWMGVAAELDAEGHVVVVWKCRQYLPQLLRSCAS